MKSLPTVNSHQAKELRVSRGADGISPRLPPAGESDAWRFAILHFPCLEPISPRGELVMVSDKRHIAEARRAHPDLPLWHEAELGLFGALLDPCKLDEEAFVSVNKLKLKVGGWFIGVDESRHGITLSATGSSE